MHADPTLEPDQGVPRISRIPGVFCGQGDWKEQDNQSGKRERSFHGQTSTLVEEAITTRASTAALTREEAQQFPSALPRRQPFGGSTARGLSKRHMLSAQEEPADQRDRHDLGGVEEEGVADGGLSRHPEDFQGKHGGVMEHADITGRRWNADAESDECQYRPSRRERQVKIHREQHRPRGQPGNDPHEKCPSDERHEVPASPHTVQPLNERAEDPGRSVLDVRPADGESREQPGGGLGATASVTRIATATRSTASSVAAVYWKIFGT